MASSPEARAPSGRNHLRSVEGARGLAALSILTYHTAKLGNEHGFLEAATTRFWLGVPFFFVLSGFLLFRPFAHAAVHGRPWPSLSRYARARVLRIVPAYWLVLTVSIFQLRFYFHLYPVALAAAALVLWISVFLTRPSMLRSVAAIALTCGAVYALSRHPLHAAWPGFANYLLVYIPFAQWQGVVGTGWSLCIEISFYVFLPLLAFALAHYSSRATGVHARARRLLVMLSFLLPFGIVYLWINHPTTQSIWLPAYIDEFAVGMMLAVALERWPHVSVRASRTLLLVALALALVANTIYGVGPHADPYGNGSGVFFSRMMAVAFALILASILMRDEQTAIGHVLSSRTLVALGTISYGIYLWHFLIIQRLQTTPLWGSEETNLVLVLALTLAVATTSWLVVERPLLARKDDLRLFAHRRRRVRDAEPAVGGVPSVAEQT